jgi:putative membrane protein
MRRRPVLYVAAVLLAVFSYDAVVRSALLGLVKLPSIPGGLKVLTAILAVFSLTHAWYSIGGRLTLAFFALSSAISWAYEQAGISTGLVFGAYHYTDYLGSRLGDVPVLIPLAWFMMIYPSYVIANLLVERRPLGTPGGVGRLVRLAAASAVVMTAWDLVVDPILSGPSVKAWIWETGGPYFGIPLHNYAGWLLTTFTVYLAYRALERRWTRDELAAEGGAASYPGGATLPLGPAAAALPVAAYGLMLIADLLSGAAPDGLAVIGPVVMGVPFAAAVWRLRRLGRRPDLGRRVGPEPAGSPARSGWA